MSPFVVTVSNRLHDKWCMVLGFTGAGKTTSSFLPFIATLHFDDSNEHENSYYLKPFNVLFFTLVIGIVYIPKQCKTLLLNPIDLDQNKQRILKKVWLTPLPRIFAAVFVGLLNPIFTLNTLFDSKYRPITFRQLIRLIATSEPQNLTYKTWYELYDNAKKKNYWLTRSVNIDIKTYSSYDGSTDTYARVLKKTNTFIPQYYIGILQDSEIISIPNLDVITQFAQSRNYPDALYGDVDFINAYQERSQPYFKPSMEYAMLCSGLLTTGIWLIRKDVFEEFERTNKQKFTCAYSHRLALAFYIKHKNGIAEHIPHVLTHSTQTLSQTIIQEVHSTIVAELDAQRWHYEISKKDVFPILAKPISDHHHVTIVIPTTLNNRHVANCIQSVIKKTAYPHCEFLLVLSQNCQFSDEQTRNLTHLLAYENVNYLQIYSEPFNFSKSCNDGIKLIQTDYVVIVNDDVTPINDQWLHYMMGHMQDDRVAAVGAKLYYKQGLIQHNGIVMGAGNFCEHKDRFKKDDELYFKGDFDCSAVTGACMLLRKSAIDTVNGFNETLAIAYNDVDLCLKLRKFKYRVVQCQHATLIHYESFSLKNHYKGDRKGKERNEILYMRAQWADTIRYDPFYNPNLSLQIGRLGKLAFPPRKGQLTHPTTMNRLYDP